MQKRQLSVHIKRHLGQKFLVTGLPGVGKTTLLQALADTAQNPAGFLTLEVRGKDGKRLGFDVVTVDGKERAPLARVTNSPGNQTGPKVGQYSVNVHEFEKIALRSLNEDVLRGASLVIVDEVGKMESFSKKFEARVKQIFDEDHAERKIVATVPARRDGGALGLARELVEREDTKVVEVTKANRDMLMEELVAKLA